MELELFSLVVATLAFWAAGLGCAAAALVLLYMSFVWTGPSLQLALTVLLLGCATVLLLVLGTEIAPFTVGLEVHP